MIPKPLFDFEHLDVYKLTMELLPVSETLENKLRSVRPNLASQLGRAVDSVHLNLAEGAGEFSRLEKARIYRIARRSATESAACLDNARARRILTLDDIAGAREMLYRIVSMITKLCLNCGSRTEPGKNREIWSSEPPTTRNDSGVGEAPPAEVRQRRA